MLEDLTDKVYGKLTVKRFHGIRTTGIKRPVTQRYWECLCECGKITIGSTSKIKRGEKVSCGCKILENLNHRSGKNHNGWSGYEDISGTIFARISGNAKQRNKEFNITIEYCWELFQQQNGKCKLTGLDLYFAKNQKELSEGKNTASLDRIDSKKGYIVGNVQWVHVDVNYMKQEYSQEYFIQMCKLISSNN